MKRIDMMLIEGDEWIEVVGTPVSAASYPGAVRGLDEVYVFVEVDEASPVTGYSVKMFATMDEVGTRAEHMATLMTLHGEAQHVYRLYDA